MANWSSESRHKRGYGTQWEKIRIQILQRDNYLCHCNLCKGGELRLRAATEVNHKIPKAWFKDGRAKGDPDHPDNLQAINSECHKRVSMEQRGVKPRPRIGLDGYEIPE
jgi:5-methylcytosine-specific restriction protein A